MKYIFILILISSKLVAQVPLVLFTMDAPRTYIDSAAVIEFKMFIDKLCENGSDTFLLKQDSIIKYRVIFTTEGEFVDPKHHLLRRVKLINVKKTGYPADVYALANKSSPEDSLQASRFLEPISTCLSNKLLGEPLPDSTIVIQSTPSFWGSGVGVKQIIFSRDLITIQAFSNQIRERTLISPSVISYQNGKFILVDAMRVLKVGNQTDSGHVVTYYLQRMY